MTTLKPPHDPVEALGEAYELLLEKTLAKTRALERVTARAVHDMVDKARDELVDLGRVTEKEGEELAAALKRDLTEAARYLQETGRDLRDWLGFDLELLEDRFREDFFAAADQTTVALNALRLAAEAAEYHSGEITGPGTLVCLACGERLHFKRAGRLPPCPRCHGTRFRRQAA